MVHSMTPLKVKIVYDDDKSVEIDITLEMLDSFINSLHSSFPFWSQDSSVGFWTPISKIRYVIINKEMPQPQSVNPKTLDEMDTPKEIII